jgi:hypothetical protein
MGLFSASARVCVGAEIQIYQSSVLSNIHEFENMKYVENLGYYIMTNLVIYAHHLEYVVKSKRLRRAGHAARIERQMHVEFW